MDAELSVVQYEEKIKQLLDKFLDPNFVITSDTYLNNLLSHLSGKENKELGSALLNLPIFTEWLITATKYWEEFGRLPSVQITNFTLNIASLLSTKEEKFVYLNSTNTYIRLCTVLKVRSQNASPLVKLSYIKLLSSFLEHNSGINWLISTNHWQDVIGYCLESQTTYVSKEGYNFVYNTLVKGSQCNQVFCSIIVEKIMTVFNEMNFINGIVNDASLQKKITPSLHLIGYIFESCLKSESFSNRNYDIPSVFLKNCHLEQNIWNIIMISSQNEKLFEDLNRIMILVHLFGLAIDSETQIFQVKVLKKTVEQIYKLLTMNITKGFVRNVPKMGYLLQHYWKLLDSRLPSIDFNSDEVQIVFETQILIIQIFPSCMIPYKVCGISLEKCIEDDLRDHFASKVFKRLCEHTVRLLYNYRTAMLNDKHDVFELTLMATSYVMKSLNNYHRERGVIIFQFYMYVLNDVITTIKLKPNMIEVFNKQIAFFTTTFNLLSTCIQKFDITWRESVETICVMGGGLDFMNLGFWPPKLIVQILKLVNLSISRFMSPNLALLVEGTSDSSSLKLGTMLTSKLHDREWEIRDSALEVLHTIASISHKKYPSFQTMIVDLELPSMMVTMAVHDTDSYVRASAIKCLQEMIKVSAFWNPILQQQDLPSKMIHVLYNETEAVVRCEAACLMSKIYEHQSFPKFCIEKVYEAMVFAATTDLDWEVRERALDFWGKVIQCYLTDQGMIDGSFPSVTFSKENRKIVTLTEIEIKNRLNKVLKDLSSCGCLGVLVACMQDDCDIKVLKKAVEITQTLGRLLTLYNIIGDLSPPTVSPKAVLDTFNLGSSSNVSLYSDKIVNDIVNSRDIGLLVNVFQNDQDFSSTNEIKMKQCNTSPHEFLVFIQRDLDNLIVERTKWIHQIDNLGSLLDDILKCYNDDVNVMDCY